MSFCSFDYKVNVFPKTFLKYDIFGVHYKYRHVSVRMCSLFVAFEWVGFRGRR